MKGKAVKKYNKVTIKTDYYITQTEKPEHSIDEIIEGHKALGGIPEITGTKLVDEMPK